MYTFREFLESQEEDPVTRWQRMRAETPGLGDNPPIQQYKSGQYQRQERPSHPKLSDPVINVIMQGFKNGSSVTPTLIRHLQLSDANKHLVADNFIDTSRGSYPFYREKNSGIPTGKILYVKDFPIDSFLRMYS